MSEATPPILTIFNNNLVPILRLCRITADILQIYINACGKKAFRVKEAGATVCKVAQVGFQMTSEYPAAINSKGYFFAEIDHIRRQVQRKSALCNGRGNSLLPYGDSPSWFALLRYILHTLQGYVYLVARNGYFVACALVATGGVAFVDFDVVESFAVASIHGEVLPNEVVRAG